MTDKKRALADHSKRLLEALRRMRDTEKRKRQEPISTPKFHKLADEVNRASNEVFRLAREEERLGDESPRGTDSIDDIERRESGGREN